MTLLTGAPTIGIDIGGSLAKFVLLDDADTHTASESRDTHPLERYIRSRTEPSAALPPGWRSKISKGDKAVGESSVCLRALWLPTADLAEAIDCITEAQSHAPASSGETTQPLRVAATGGGALKHKAELEAKLRLEIAFVNELEAVSGGWQFDAEQLAQGNDREIGYPALVCNIGTGVSILSVSRSGGFERVTGSGIGGATYWGLVQKLTKFKTFDEAIRAAHTEGHAGNADTLVGDIYGAEASGAIGMPADLVAGFLGKLSSPGVSDADIAAALLRMMTSNLGQLAVFQAQLLSIDVVWFTGGFTEEAVVRGALEQAVAFWSAGKVGARFPQDASLLEMLRQTASKLAQKSSAFAPRRYITHVPRVASMGKASTYEHAPVETFSGDITFNEDIAIERFHEKAIANDSIRAAANFDEIRVLPSSSSQNVHVVYGH
ncbi:fumble-domain-containing protein [Martensiomyces pterosporus]|nr:fumble-domain-containing protein [Martensiomyces pterosporus]